MASFVVFLQKLSIYGDLDYLKSLDDKALLASIHPQDKVTADPLPIKIQVQRIWRPGHCDLALGPPC